MGILSRILHPLSGRSHAGSGSLPAAPRELLGQFSLDVNNEVVTVSDALKSDIGVLQWIEELRESRGLRYLKVEWAPLSLVGEKLAHAHHSENLIATENDRDMRAAALDLLKWGNDIGASDIHIRVLSRFALIEVRLDNQILEAREITTGYADKLMRGLYNLSPNRGATYSETSSQDAAIGGPVLRGTGLVNVRIVHGPCAPISDSGHCMILRLQSSDNGRVRNAVEISRLRPTKIPEGRLELENQGWTAEQSEMLQEFMLAPTGSLFLTGPPGSGKTHVMHALSAHRQRIMPGQRQVFVEQPVELIAPWAIQLDIANTLDAKATGEAYAARTRQALRMDTNFLGLGEIRDAYIARIWLEAANGGMSMMTTMHTSSPFEVPSRLRDMDPDGLNFSVICNTAIISGLVAMRLVPLVCPHCAVPWTTGDTRFPPRVRQAIASWSQGRSTDHLRRVGPGCDHCSRTGYAGRRVVAEVVDADEELMGDFIEFGATVARHRYHARPKSDTTMLEKAMGLVFEGVLDPFDARMTGRIRSYDDLMHERELGQRTPGAHH